MEVIKNGNIVDDEEVVHLADDDPVNGATAFTVSLSRWKSERDELAGKPGLGVRLDGYDDVHEAAADLEHFERVALEFPQFTDGRCYSFARLLRDRYGYTGELRAIGDVLRDQLFFMLRCGIDTFEVREDKDVQAALDAFEDFSVTYQTAADGRPPVYRQ